MTQMTRYYKTPVLLIEFDAHRAFHLLSRSDLSGEIQSKSLTSKLILLCLHFPQIRLMWARSSHVTASMFTALKEKQFEPQVEQALVSAADTQMHTIDSNDMSIETDDAVLHERAERGDRHTLTTSYDMLRKLPGVTAANIRHLTASIKSLRDLAQQTLPQLTALIGETQAKKLHSFLHDSVGTLFAPI
jgi:DNA excision repair protein ERCC-4